MHKNIAHHSRDVECASQVPARSNRSMRSTRERGQPLPRVNATGVPSNDDSMDDDDDATHRTARETYGSIASET